MKKEIADKWVAALRSGEYKQGTQRLHALIDFFDNGRDVQKGHCCLGVLCEVAIKDGLEIERDAVDTSVYYDDQDEDLPHSVMEFTGIRTRIGELVIDGSDEALAGLNDAGMSFTEIADIIEKHWEKL